MSGGTKKDSFDMNLFLKKTLSNYDMDDNTDSENSQKSETTCHRRTESTGSNVSKKSAKNTTSPPCAYCGKRERLDAKTLYCNYCINVLQCKEEVHRRLLLYNEEPRPGRPLTPGGSNHSPGIPLEPDDSELNFTYTPGLPLEPEVSQPCETSALLNESSRLLRSHESGSKPVIVADEELDAYPVPGSKNKFKKCSQTSSFASQSSLNRPLCRICQLPGEPSDVLISPCRCSGTMQYVHKSCLVHWLEISTRKSCPSPRCELCGYQYRTYHCLKVQKLHMPECSNRDKGFHSVFLMMLIVMFGCAVLSIFYLQFSRGGPTANLSAEDIVVITCSIMFFLAFFVAVFTQYRAEATLCTLCFRWWLINKHWRIRNYDVMEDKTRWVNRAAAV